MQMDKLRGLLGGMDRALLNDESGGRRIDESVFLWFGDIERMGNKIAKRVCVRECMGNCLISRQRKRWIDSVNDCYNKSLYVKERRRMVHGRGL